MEVEWNIIFVFIGQYQPRNNTSRMILDANKEIPSFFLNMSQIIVGFIVSVSEQECLFDYAVMRFSDYAIPS